MMDCLEAQRLISEKLDRAPVDAALLNEAKEHCRVCPECGAFVRAQLAVTNASLPLPPEGLPDRIMSAVHSEAKPVAVLETATAADWSESAPTVVESPASPGTEQGAAERLSAAFNDPRNYKTIVAWTAAAAVVFVIAGIGAISGVRQIFTPPATGERGALSVAPETVTEQGAGDLASPGPATAATGAAEGAATSSAAAGASYITVSGTAYRAAGPAVGIDPKALKPLGSTRTALGGDGAPRSRDVFGLDDPARVYLSDDADGYLGFDRVTRSYDGHVYALRSGSIDSYGQWPSLPSGVQAPTSTDGSPYYTSLGKDDGGIEVFGRAGSSSSGILVGPGTPGSDPAAGNPGWTWWTPIR